MKIRILHYARGAAEARGLTVVIDVFRAFSAACYAFDRGAARIIATDSIDFAFKYREQFPEALLMGERHARKIEGFDLGNSPSEILDTDLADRTIVHTTHAGTRALIAATSASDVITGSFVNAGAIIDYIRDIRPDRVSLVCAGFEGRNEALEDTLCAQYIKSGLLGKKPESAGNFDQLDTAPSARRFFDPDDMDSPRIDLDLCLAVNRFDLVIRKTRDLQNAAVLKRV